jgi:hypothetical protein
VSSQAEAVPQAEILERMRRYSVGEPLNEELAEIRTGERGTLAEIAAQAAADRPIDEENPMMTRSDKAAIRAMRTGEQWPALEKLVKIAVQRRQRSATLLSQEDPLSQGAQLANAWAYVKMSKEFWIELKMMVEAAAATVESEEAE